jgi:hypothetical protein
VTIDGGVAERRPDPFLSAPKWWPDWRGQSCVIIASGPSAKDVPVGLARGRAKVITINTSYQLAPWADVLYACDFRWWDVHKGVPSFAGLKITQDGPKFGKKYTDVRHIYCDHGTDALLMVKFGVIGWGGNSGFNAINLAAQFGVIKIILVGFDMRMDKGLHWHGKHGAHLNNPTERNIFRWCKAIDDAAPALKSLGIRVFNASPVSKLNNYPKVSFEEALNCDP